MDHLPLLELQDVGPHSGCEVEPQCGERDHVFGDSPSNRFDRLVEITALLYGSLTELGCIHCLAEDCRAEER